MSDEVARLEAFSVSATTLLSLQALPSAPPLTNPNRIDSQDHQQSAADNARSPPQPDGDARFVGPAQSVTGPGFTAPQHESSHQLHLQQHTAKVMPLPSPTGTIRTGQGPPSGISAVSSSIHADQMHGVTATAVGQMAHLRHLPEDDDDIQTRSDGGSCESTFDSESPMVSGAPQEYQSVIRNPLAGIAHHGKRCL